MEGNQRDHMNGVRIILPAFANIVLEKKKDIRHPGDFLNQ